MPLGLVGGLQSAMISREIVIGTFRSTARRLLGGSVRSITLVRSSFGVPASVVRSAIGRPARVGRARFVALLGITMYCVLISIHEGLQCQERD